MSTRVDYNQEYGALHGHCLHEKMTPEHFAMTLIVVENNISTDDDTNTLKWKCHDQVRKYTPPKARTTSGGWNQDAIDMYVVYLEREKKQRKEIASKYENNRTGWPDYFTFSSQQKPKVKSIKKPVVAPDAKEVSWDMDTENRVINVFSSDDEGGELA